jgi:hypothetical protein
VFHWLWEAVGRRHLVLAQAAQPSGGQRSLGNRGVKRQ